MQIQHITQQPNFTGKIVFEKGTTIALTRNTSAPIWRKFKDVATLISPKPYDIFILRDKRNSEFYDIAANKTIEDAQKIKGYTVKVKSNVIAESVVDAAKEAINMYEKYIAKGIKG